QSRFSFQPEGRERLPQSGPICVWAAQHRVWLLAGRAFGYMLVAGGVHYVALPWLLLTLVEGNSLQPLELRSGLALITGALIVLFGVSLALLSAVHLVW